MQISFRKCVLCTTDVHYKIIFEIYKTYHGDGPSAGPCNLPLFNLCKNTAEAINVSKFKWFLCATDDFSTVVSHLLQKMAY